MSVRPGFALAFALPGTLTYVNCTEATITALDTAGFVGNSSWVTIGADGLGLISYQDGTNGDLKVLHCSNALCTPYFRRR